MKKLLIILACISTFFVQAQKNKIKIVFRNGNGTYQDRSGNAVFNVKVPGVLIIPKASAFGLTNKQVPVLCVHGITSNGQNQMLYWMNSFNAKKIRSAYISLLPLGTADENASILKNAIDSLTAFYNVPQIAMVAHSKGGVDTEFALYKKAAARKIAYVFTFGSPHRGGAGPDLLSASYIVDIYSYFSNSNLSNAVNSVNSGSLNYYFSNASNYSVFKKSSPTTFAKVNPKTDIYTKWRTYYGNDVSHSANGGFSASNQGMIELSDAMYIKVCGLVNTYCSMGKNDGVVTNQSSMREKSSTKGISTQLTLSSNGNHLKINQGSNSLSWFNALIPYTTSVYKTDGNGGNGEVFYENEDENNTNDNENELELNSTIHSNMSIISSKIGKSNFTVEESNKLTKLTIHAERKPIFVEIKNIETGEVVSSRDLRIQNSYKDDFSYHANGLEVVNYNINNLPKGKYSIETKEPFFGFVQYETELDCMVDLGFKDSEGFVFDERSNMKIIFSDLEKLNLSNIQAQASVRKITDLEGNSIDNPLINSYKFNPAKDNSTSFLETSIKDDLESGIYNITVDVKSFNNNNLQNIDRTFTKTFFVNKKGKSTGLNNDKKFEEKIKLFPNPSQNSVNIAIDANLSNYSIEIYSITGNLVKLINETNNETENIQLDLNDLSNGLYILKLKTVEFETSTKLTILK